MPKLRKQGVGQRAAYTCAVSPRRLLRTASIAEAASWTLLIAGMILKYPLQGSGLLVSVAGSLHAVAFLGYLGCILLIGTDRRWPARSFVWIRLGRT